MAGLLGLLAPLQAEEDPLVYGKDFVIKGEQIGTPVDLDTFKGKPILLYWGDVTCPRCTVWSRDFGRFTKSAANKDIGVIAVQSRRVPAKDLQDHIRENRISCAYFPSNDNIGLYGKAMNSSFLRGIPRFVVIAADGRIEKSYSSFDDAKKAIEKLAKEKKNSTSQGE